MPSELTAEILRQRLPAKLQIILNLINQCNYLIQKLILAFLGHGSVNGLIFIKGKVRVVQRFLFLAVYLLESSCKDKYQWLLLIQQVQHFQFVYT